MNQLSTTLTLVETINAVNSYMTDLGYSPNTMRHFRECWNVLKKHATSHGEIILTNELGMTFLKEHYKIEMYSHKLSSYKNLIRRAVMLLLEYQTTGEIFKRQPSKEHEFPDGFRVIAEHYISHISNDKDLSLGTIRNHRRCIERFASFMVNHEITNISLLKIENINNYLQTFSGYARSYIASTIHILKAFTSYAFENCVMDKDFLNSWPVVTVMKDRDIPKIFSADEIVRILKAVDCGNARGKRDFALLMLATHYGLRVSDVKALKFSNLDFVNNAIDIVQQKTKKPLHFRMLPEIGWALIDYIKNGRPKSDSENVFIRHVTPYDAFAYSDSLQQIIYRYALTAGVVTSKEQRCSMHMLRYSLASNLLLQDAPLHVVKDILGHAELNTTTIYTKIDIPQLKLCALEVPYED